MEFLGYLYPAWSQAVQRRDVSGSLRGKNKGRRTGEVGIRIRGQVSANRKVSDEGREEEASDKRTFRCSRRWALWEGRIRCWARLHAGTPAGGSKSQQAVSSGINEDYAQIGRAHV